VLLDRPPLTQQQKWHPLLPLRTRVPLRFALVAVLAVLLLAAAEVLCVRLDVTGPTVQLLRSYVFEQPSAPGIYCGLALVLVLLRPRLRWWALGSAVAIDAVFAIVRLVVHGQVRSFGNGALFVLTVLTVYAVVRLRGIEQVNAFRGLACGGALVAATTLGNVWLDITARVRPRVLDEYVELADRALGSPSWVMGQVFAVLGSPGHYAFLAVYSMLPVASVFVAVVQLRRGWLRHNVILTFIAIGVVGPLIYLLYPVVGPAYAFGTSGGSFAMFGDWPRQLPGFSAARALPFDDFTPRNCMPSLHTAWAVILFVHTRPMGRWMRRLGTIWLLGTLAATLGFGYHYGVDLVVGAVFALTIEAAMRSRVCGWGRERRQLVAFGAAVVGTVLIGVRYGTAWISANPVPSAVLVLGALAAMVLGYWYSSTVSQPVRPAAGAALAAAPVSPSGQRAR